MYAMPTDFAGILSRQPLDPMIDKAADAAWKQAERIAADERLTHAAKQADIAAHFEQARAAIETAYQRAATRYDEQITELQKAMYRPLAPRADEAAALLFVHVHGT